MHLPGTLLTFRPRCNNRMHVPILRDECAESGPVEFHHQTGAIKLWPGEQMTVARVLSAEALICTWGRKTLLLLTADTQPAE